MEALQFDVSVPRYIAGKVLGAVYEPLFWSGLSCLRYGQIDEPSLPGPDWVKIHTRYGGICGTDWGLVHLHNSLYLAPFGSERFVLGHENLGTIAEVGPEVEGWSVGERVIADLVLPCAPRGFVEPCPACQRAILAPTRHASVDKALVLRHALVGPQAQPLHDARAKAFEQRIRFFAQPQHELAAPVRLEIHVDRRPAAVHQVEAVGNRDTGIGAWGTPQADDLRAHVRQQHAAQLGRANARDLDDPDSIERTHDPGLSVQPFRLSDGFSSRAIRLDVSQRLPPSACTSA